jgi:hypothetical protein
MRKSTLFISAVLTTFVMAMLAGVASAYQKMTEADQIAATAPETQPEAKAIANYIPAATPTEVQPVNWTPEEASALAAQVLGHDDLYSVEVADLDGETVYMVTFSSGDLVYINLDGQIRSIGKVEVETVVVNTGGKGKSGGNNNKSSNSNQSHEDHDDDHDDEHEEHDDD